MRRGVAGAYNRAVNKRPGHVVRREDGEPAADLTEHRVVHRGIDLDLRRLAAAAEEIASAPAQGEVRWYAFGEYLTALAMTTRSHLRVDNVCLTELLANLIGAAPTPPADATSQLFRLLDEAQDIVAASDGPPEGPISARLATELTQAARVAGALFGWQESVLFPLVLQHVRAVDHHWVLKQFRAELPPGLLAFVVPWTMRHATAEELPALTDPALCVTNRIFAQRFIITESLLFR
jgi:hypothetical protein